MNEAVMDVVVDPREWAEYTFADCKLGDPRRTKRLVDSAAEIAAHPEKMFTQLFDWNDLRGFYRLCNQSVATTEVIQMPHWQQTRQAMTQQPLVLILHDTTELDFSSHWKLKGLGQIGNEKGRGFLQHNSVAVVPEPRQVLGLAYQQLKTRQPAPPNESTYQRKRRVRESQLWQEGFRAPGRPPKGCVWVDVCDRGSDDYESMREARNVGHDFLIRVAQNRIVYLSSSCDQKANLLDFSRTMTSVGNDAVEIPGRRDRPARTATVHMAAAPVWVPAAVGTVDRKLQPIIPAWVIRVWEPNPPAGTIEPLEWVLLCSVPTETLEELKERRDWYCCRWMVEVYHDIEKNGCSEEDRRFETVDRMETCLAILAVVAVRVFQMRYALEHQPDSPAEHVGTKEEIQVIRKLTRHVGKHLTVRDFVRGVAKLGGFLGRKGDGDPGVRALWKGYQRLQDMLQGIRLLVDSDSS
jgi:hypothetical protein